MDLGNHYAALELRLLDEQWLQHQLEQRRMIAERVAERAAETAGAAGWATDAARPRRGIRALLPRRLRALTPPRPANP
ncbi:MAG TPA: hypothetical protein VFM66_00860 [Agromyces sp.]|nr:hypothetical protein [Agromyces sp.]